MISSGERVAFPVKVLDPNANGSNCRLDVPCLRGVVEAGLIPNDHRNTPWIVQIGGATGMLNSVAYYTTMKNPLHCTRICVQ